MKKRIEEVLIAGEWIRIDFKEIKSGDWFRLFESDDMSPVKDDNGKKEWEAKSDCYMNKNGVYAINVI